MIAQIELKLASSVFTSSNCFIHLISLFQLVQPLHGSKITIYSYVTETSYRVAYLFSVVRPVGLVFYFQMLVPILAVMYISESLCSLTYSQIFGV